MRSILKKTVVLPISILVYMGTIFTFPSAAQDYVEDPINLLVNPDWEDGMEGWEILASNHKVLFGDHEALCSIVYQDIPVEDYMYGNAVRLSGYIALASQDSTQEYMDLALMMGGFDGYVVDGFEEDGSFTYSDYESADSTELIWHEITMDIPDEADFIRVSFEIRKQTDKNYYNFSDLSLELIEKEQTGDDSFINVTGSTYDEESGFVIIT